MAPSGKMPSGHCMEGTSGPLGGCEWPRTPAHVLLGTAFSREMGERGALALVYNIEVIIKSSLVFLKGGRDLSNCQIVRNVHEVITQEHCGARVLF